MAQPTVIKQFVKIAYSSIRLGSSQDRTDSEGLKLACTHFQYAAWAFQTINEKYQTESTTDLSLDLLQFFSQICLAQAQECILEKSILDHRKPAIIGKVIDLVCFYLGWCRQPPLGS